MKAPARVSDKSAARRAGTSTATMYSSAPSQRSTRGSHELCCVSCNAKGAGRGTDPVDPGDAPADDRPEERPE